MVLTSFSQEEYEQTIRDESYQEGIKCGKEQETENGIKKLIVSLKRLEIPQEKIHSEVKKAYNLSEEETTQYIEKYREETKETEND